MMSPLEIEELMSQNFPWVESHEREWENVHDGAKPKLESISRLLESNIGQTDMFVQVLGDSDVAALVSAEEAPSFVAGFVLKGRIHVTNRQFTGFVVIQPIGVAAGWRA
jgi:hypothetical protein